MLDQHLWIEIHGARRQGHQLRQVGNEKIPALLDGCFGAAGRDADDQRHTVGDFTGDDFDSASALVVSEFVGFAGESIDTQPIYTAVKFKSYNAPQPASSIWPCWSKGMNTMGIMPFNILLSVNYMDKQS